MARRAGETATINGFRTEKVEVFADGEIIEENWVTRDVDLSETEKAMEQAAGGLSTELQSQMAEGREIYEKLKPYGFPILVKEYTIAPGMKPIDVLEVKSVEKKELDETVFLPPKGYERVIVAPSNK